MGWFYRKKPDSSSSSGRRPRNTSFHFLLIFPARNKESPSGGSWVIGVPPVIINFSRIVHYPAMGVPLTRKPPLTSGRFSMSHATPRRLWRLNSTGSSLNLEVGNDGPHGGTNGLGFCWANVRLNGIWCSISMYCWGLLNKHGIETPGIPGFHWSNWTMILKNHGIPAFKRG